MIQDSIVSIPTCYGQDSPGTESWWEQDFLYQSILALEPTQSSVLGLFSRDKVAGTWPRSLTPPSSAKVKVRLEQYLFTPLGPSWPVLG